MLRDGEMCKFKVKVKTENMGPDRYRSTLIVVSVPVDDALPVNNGRGADPGHVLGSPPWALPQPRSGAAGHHH